MNKIAIIYASVHHHNTKKLVEGIAANCKIDLINILTAENIDLSSYNLVGYASGIYMSTFHKSLIMFIEKHNNLPNKAFLMYTSGSGSKKYANSFKRKLEEKNINVIGIYSCKGYDTYGFWKFLGGIAKGHPSPKDILNGTCFINKLIDN